MTRRFTRILAALALLVFMTPSMVTWGQDNYVVEFASTTTSNDGTAAITTLTDIVSSGADFITSITDATKVYKGKQGYGVKLGSSSAVGSFVMNLSDAGKVEAVGRGHAPVGAGVDAVEVGKRDDTGKQGGQAQIGRGLLRLAETVMGAEEVECGEENGEHSEYHQVSGFHVFLLSEAVRSQNAAEGEGRVTRKTD